MYNLFNVLFVIFFTTMPVPSALCEVAAHHTTSVTAPAAINDLPSSVAELSVTVAEMHGRPPKHHTANTTTNDNFDPVFKDQPVYHARDTISFTNNKSYTLSADARTSAGVYNKDVLIRTLWSNEQRKAGTYSLATSWDGKDDNGNYAPDGSYTIKVVSNNVTYEWLKPIGNSSISASGPGVHNPAQMITNMAQVGGSMYYAAGYNETADAHCKFEVGAPNVNTTSLKGGGQVIRFLATDGRVVYSGGQNLGPTTFITGIVPNSNGVETLASFSSGTSFSLATGSSFVYSAFDITPNADYLTGMAVMQAGNYLFAAHRTLNQLRVYNKTTGALVQTLSVTSPRELAVKENDLWMISGTNTVAKYTINSDGALSNATLMLNGLTDPLAVAVSPDGSKVGVCDRGAFHQVKFFSASNGALLSTLGRAESYANPTVYNDKFHFSNTRIFREDDYGTTHAFLTFQADGSYWVGDYGNMRCQHFSSAGGYLDNIQYLGYSYSTQADINNPTRIFSDFLEFSINYADNSWRFVKNWSKNITIPTVFDADRMRSVSTLANGRTYALYNLLGPGRPREIIELDNVTGIRHTGVLLNDVNCELYPDGSVWQIGQNVVGETTFWQRKALTGFDATNNPQWGNYAPVETSPVISATDPLTADGYLKRAHNTSSGVIATFCSDNGTSGRGTGWHLGGIKNGQWLFKASPSTTKHYQGSFPPDGAYDIGNGVNNAGSFMQAVDRHIFWGYNGEFWKASQTNKYNHYLDNGLMIGQFGVSGDVAGFSHLESYPGMAGNALSGTYVKVGGDIHYFHCDEGEHAAVHHWKISNLSSVAEQAFTIIKNGVPALPAVDYIDLMADVPYASTVTGAMGRWAFTPTPYNTSVYDKFAVEAGTVTYKKNERSFRLTSYPSAAGLTREAVYTLDSRSSPVWELEGQIAYPEISEPGDNFLDVLDDNNKVIVRLSRPEDYPNLTIKANNTTIVRGDLNALKQVIIAPRPLSIRSDGRSITLRYADYAEVTTTLFDATATISRPKAVRIHFYSSDKAGHQIDLANLKFHAGSTITPGTGTGLAGEYFNNINLTAPAAVVRTDAQVNFVWPASPISGTVNADLFGVRWSGQLEAPVSGTYVFTTICDDGVRLWVNGVKLIDNWAFHTAPDVTTAVTLMAGQKYDIRMEYFDGYGGAKAQLYWAYPGQSQQAIPQQRLYPATIAPPLTGPAPGTGTGLAGEYFNNINLTAPAAVVRTDAQVNFVWPASPISGTVNADLFGVRWSGQLEAPVSGTYVFTTICDDGVRLWVNGVKLIDNWAFHTAPDVTTAVTLMAGQKYDIRMEYFDGYGGAKAQLYWAYPGQSQQAIPQQRLYPATIAPPLTGPAPGTGTGLAGEYFNNINLTAPAAVVRTDAQVNFVWPASPISGTVNADLFGVRWSGQLEAPVSGTYVFTTICDDGVRLWVNGVKLIDNWAFHTAPDVTTAVTLMAGQKYDIRMEYFDGYGGAKAQLYWAYPGQSQQAIPQQRLYPATISAARQMSVNYARVSSVENETSDITWSLKAFPVPARDVVWIRYFAKEPGDVSLQLFSITAQQVLQLIQPAVKGENVFKISVREFNRGVYLLNLTQGYNRLTRRILLSD